MSRVGLLMRKVGCTSIFDDESYSYKPVTLLCLEDSSIISMVDCSDGDAIVKVGYGSISSSRLNKAQKSIYARAEVEPKRKMLQFRVSDSSSLATSQNLSVEHFAVGQYVDATAKSIGKGFAGVIKRHNFKGLAASHGVSISHRAHGSTGQCQDPGRVFKGKKMAGRMGGKKVTIQSLRILDVDVQRQLIAVHGSVPGPKNGYVLLRDAKKKRYVNG